MIARRGRGGTVPSQAKIEQMRNQSRKKNEDRQKKLRNATQMARRRKEHIDELKPYCYIDADRPLCVEISGAKEVEGSALAPSKKGISLTRGVLPSWIGIPAKIVPESFANDVESGAGPTRGEIKKIDTITFSMLSNEEALLQSVFQAEPGPVYDQKSMEPRETGINDLRGGTLCRANLCDKCGNDIEKCTGHGSHIALPLACYHPTTIEKAHRSLCCLCYFCSSLLLTKDNKKLKKLIDVEAQGKAFSMGRFDLARSGDVESFEKDPDYAREAPSIETAKTRATRFAKIVASMEKMPKKTCPRCGIPQPKYFKKGLYLDVEWTPYSLKLMSDEERALALTPFTPEMAACIFDKVTDETAEIMGVGSAKTLRSMILRNLYVIPPVARPSIAAFEGAKKRSGDYITQKTMDIQKVVRDLELAILNETEEGRREEFDRLRPKTVHTYQEWTRLQLHIGLMINRKSKMGKGFGPKSDLVEAYGGTNTDKIAADLVAQEAQKHLSTGKAHDYDNRLSGKNGRFRCNLSGKRVDFSARLVISPDPKVPIDEVLVPRYVALGLTYPERVFDGNLEAMRKCVSIGFGRIGGAHSVKLRDGSTFFLDARDGDGSPNEVKHIEVTTGMIVNRYVRNGDPFLLNRQPSLHRGSIQCVLARIADAATPSSFVFPYEILSTIGINPQFTKPFNADFDGDEMNLHLPQNEMARAEALTLMVPKVGLLDPKNNGLMIAPIQDCVYGLWNIVNPSTFLDEEQIDDLMAEIPAFEELNKGRIAPGDPMSARARLAFVNRLGEPAIQKPKRLWTGKQLISSMLPQGFRYEKWPDDRPASEGRCATDAWIARFASGNLPWRNRSVAKEQSKISKDVKLCLRIVRKESAIKPFAERFGMDLEALNKVIAEHGRTSVAVAWLVRERSDSLGEWRDYASKRLKTESEIEAVAKADEAMTRVRSKLFPGSPAWDRFLRHEEGLVVVDGEIVTGEAKSSHFGGSTGSVLHRLSLDRRWGKAYTINLLSSLQRVVARFLHWKPLTVSLGDCRLAKKEDEEVAAAVVERILAAARAVSERCRREGIDPGRSEIERLVKDMVDKSVFDALTAKTKALCRNNLYKIVRSGAKGNLINVVQILMSYGQITVGGTRNYSQDPKSGILPAFEVGDDDPLAKAFVPMGLSRGLGPIQMFNSFKAGREGLSDTAVKTSDTGYSARRMFKVLEAVMYSYDGMVRNSNNEIVSSTFGDGNYDAKNLTKVVLYFLSLSDAEMANEMGFDLPPNMKARVGDPKRLFRYARWDADAKGSWASCEYLRKATNDLKSSTFEERTKLAQIACFERLRYFRDRIRSHRLSPTKFDLELEAYLPFDTRLELDAHARNLRDLGRIKDSNDDEYRPIMEPWEIAAMVRAFTERLRSSFSDAYVARASIEWALSPKNVYAAGLTERKELESLLRHLEYLHEAARVEPGEMVGPIASQSIAEPATQMTLNTFHYAGVGDKQIVVLTGVPRLKLSLEYSIEKQAKAAVGRVFLKRPFCESESSCRDALNSIKCIKLRHLVLYDDVLVPGSDDCVAFCLKEAEHAIEDSLEEGIDAGASSHWKDERESDGGNSVIVRFNLNKKAVRESGLLPRDVAESIQSFFGNWPVETRFSDGSYEGEWIVKVRVYDVARFSAPSKSTSSVTTKKWKTREQAAKILDKQLAVEMKRTSAKASSSSSDSAKKSKSKSKSRSKTKAAVRDKPDEVAKPIGAEAEKKHVTETLDRMGKNIACELMRRLHVSGIRGIKGGQMSSIEYDAIDRDTGAIVRRKEWFIETKRCVLKKLMGLPFVDASKTYSTNSQEIEATFGILGVKASLMNAIKDALGCENRIDGRHVDVLVSTMTHLGYVVRASRFGLNKLDTGTLTRASFEQTVDILCKAAIHNEKDALKDPMACLIAGQMAPMGPALIAVKPTADYVNLIDRIVTKRKRDLHHETRNFSLDMKPGLAWSTCFERTVECAMSRDEEEVKRKEREELDALIASARKNATASATQMADSPPLMRHKKSTSSTEDAAKKGRTETPASKNTFSWLL